MATLFATVCNLLSFENTLQQVQKTVVFVFLQRREFAILGKKVIVTI